MPMPGALGAQFIAPNQGTANQGAINRAPTLGDVVRAFKARVTIAMNRRRGESTVEQAALAWLERIGWAVRNGAGATL